jgi:ABC-type Fe3+/spermidine/putrescine transport system ATPase subunit
MPAIELRHIRNFILDDLSAGIEPASILVILGPNGAGKTTLLNVIAGLSRYEGEVRIDGAAVDRLSPQKRQVGYLAQHPALFPHLNVRQNVAYGISCRLRNKAAIQKRVDEITSILAIDHLCERYPRDLSGGERQRSALARALCPYPKVLLLDEPLNSLDIRTAKRLRTDFRQILKELGTTAVYVTHNPDEAEEIGDQIAVMSNGRILQSGKAEELYFNPASDEVGTYLGRQNVLSCQSRTRLGRGLLQVECGGLPVTVPDEGGDVKRIAVAAKHVYLSTRLPPGPEVNRFAATVIETAKLSPYRMLVLVKAGENRLCSELPAAEFAALRLSPGADVYVKLKLRWIKVLEK